MEKKRVLIVEDQKVIAIDIKRNIESFGYEVTSIVDSGEEAIINVETQFPDVILMDIMLKGKMDGIEAAGIIKENFSIPIIFITAYSDDSFLKRAKIVEPYAYLVKPFNKRELLFAIDIAVYKHEAKKKLEESEIQFKSIVQSSPLGIHLYHLNEKNELIFTGANPAADNLLKINHNELIGKTIELAFPSLVLTSIPGIYKKIAKTGIAWSEEQVDYKDDKIEGAYEVFAFQISPNKVAVMFNDITVRKKMEERLKQALDKAEESSRLKSVLLGNLSHEFRTPLVGILGFANILAEKADSIEEIDMIDRIIKSAQRLTNTLNSVLYFAEMEADKTTLKLQKMFLNENVRYSLKPFKETANEKNLKLTLDANTQNIEVEMDEKLFNVIFSALVDNAIKFTHNGEVKIRTDFIHDTPESDEGYAIIKVIDTGIGIPKEHLQSIFNEFKQVSEGFSRSYEGVGLGLTLANKMVKLFGGKIDVQSELNRGSVFTIYLRGRLINEEIASLRKTFVQTGEFEGFKMSKLPVILLVEDNIINKEVIVEFLSNSCTVAYARNGELAIELAEKNHYDAFLLDINLGAGLNGIQVAQRIRQMEKFDKTPLIAVTGYAMSEEKNKLINSGFTDYIAKPFTKGEIIEVIQKCLFDKTQ